ncbi:hypothetical protein M885DRAFT_505457 [Pelagophyceae sp. CCMP2097]|nr:hypothetical protein M885DRAFT_505457 [Pelagophyceae sp. CCMP2097]|mmetsp:Transcript_5796/g.20664  ORF Transcript_5796/g.20664 Transcript_5796/m.20664 type:complete len:264 (+) Transcript_5796:56-847(+)
MTATLEIINITALVLVMGASQVLLNWTQHAGQKDEQRQIETLEAMRIGQAEARMAHGEMLAETRTAQLAAAEQTRAATEELLADSRATHRKQAEQARVAAARQATELRATMLESFQLLSGWCAPRNWGRARNCSASVDYSCPSRGSPIDARGGVRQLSPQIRHQLVPRAGAQGPWGSRARRRASTSRPCGARRKERPGAATSHTHTFDGDGGCDVTVQQALFKIPRHVLRHGHGGVVAREPAADLRRKPAGHGRGPSPVPRRL